MGAGISISEKYATSIQIMLHALKNRYRLFNRIRKSSYRGEAELTLIPYLLNGGTAIDIGANKGVYSLMMSRHADKVISIEPNKKLHKYLDYLPKNCRVVYTALGEEKTTKTLYIPLDGEGRDRPNIASLDETHQQDLPKRVEEVEVTTLDDLCVNEKNIQLIKIDVEGFELSVLKGANKILSDQKPTFIIECLTDEDENQVTDLLAEYGYLSFRYFNHRLLHSSQVSGLSRDDVDRNILFFAAD